MSKSARREVRKSSKGSSEKENEKLKGKIRELSKDVDKWKRYAQSLEKRLNRTPEQMEDIKQDRKLKKENKIQQTQKSAGECKNCGSHNTKKGEIWSPHGTKYFINCQDCPHKEKIDD